MNIKKILALVLALVMVVGMLAACGGEATTTEAPATTTEATTAGKTDATTAGKTDATTAATTAATTTAATTAATTTEAPKPAGPAQAVVYIPTQIEDPSLTCASFNSFPAAGYEELYKTLETAEAVNIATGDTVEVANVVTGHLYLVETKDGATTVVADLGRAMNAAKVNRNGKSGGFSDPDIFSGVASGKYYVHFNRMHYLVNHIDVDVVNAALAAASSEVGSFGTMSIIDVTDDAITALMGDKEVNAAELNVKFVYMTYEGDKLVEATEEYSVFGLKTTTLKNIIAAEDETNADGQGSTVAFWNAYNPAGTSQNNSDELPALQEAMPVRYIFETGNALRKEGLSVVEKAKAQKDFDAAMAKYEEFLGFYEEIVNCNLWGDDIADSPVKEYWDAASAEVAEDEVVTALTYTYYYDAATDTYTIFVTDNTVGNLTYSDDRGSWLNYDDFKASELYQEIIAAREAAAE